MAHDDALLDRHLADPVEPNREPELETEFRHDIARPLAVDRHRGAVRMLHGLVELVQHDGPAVGARESRNEDAVIPARQRADHGGGGEAAETIRDQILLRFEVGGAEVDDADGIIHRRASREVRVEATVSRLPPSSARRTSERTDLGEAIEGINAGGTTILSR